MNRWRTNMPSLRWRRFIAGVLGWRVTVLGPQAMQPSPASVALLRPGATARVTATGRTREANGELSLANDRLLPSLVARMADKDQSALSELFDITVGRLNAFAQCFVQNPDLVQEVIEDVLFQVWREADRYDPDRGTVLAWMMTICRSRANARCCVDNPESVRSFDASLAQALREPPRPLQSGNAVDTVLPRVPAKARHAISLAASSVSSTSR